MTLTRSSELSHSGIDFSPASIARDYRWAYQSRQASLIGRKEVLTGKAKFGIFGDGKEVAQLAHGARLPRRRLPLRLLPRPDASCSRSAWLTLDEFFAQLYADADLDARARAPAAAR